MTPPMGRYDLLFCGFVFFNIDQYYFVVVRSKVLISEQPFGALLSYSVDPTIVTLMTVLIL